ncbi:TonB-dependent receptor [Hyphomonas sp.]|uniref:TonB-dependent receptor n=1 Tax=Hyphomonas sp. TaxID=87 RepID=UPI003919C15E
MSNLSPYARGLVRAASILALATGFATAPAVAQDAAETGRPATDETEVRQDTIIVTARKRDEDILDVPVAITALSGAELEALGIVDVEGLYGRAPSIYFSQNNTRSPQKNQTFLVMRGIGANPTTEPSVGVFIDGVYQPSASFDAGFLDVERVELLRGPQGSLFGRNTQGGALNIVTRAPSDTFEARVSAEVDTLTSFKGIGSVSGPLGERASVRASVMSSTTEGFYEDPATGDPFDKMDVLAGRLAFNVRLSDRIDVTVTADATSKEGIDAGSGVRGDQPANSFNVFEGGGDYKEDVSGLALTVNADLTDNVTLTSISGYRESLVDTDFDLDGGLFGNNRQGLRLDQNVLSQEFRLAGASEGGKFNWLVGTYFFREEDESLLASQLLDPTVPALGGFDLIIDLASSLKKEGFALFGQGTWTGYDGFLEVTGGLRWSDETVDGSRAGIIIVPSFGDFVLAEAQDENSVNFSTFLPSLQVTSHWTENIMTYVNVSKGFKTGGFDRFTGTGSPYTPLEPETTWNYEVGSKGTLGNGALTYAAALYHIRIQDMQLPTLITSPTTGLPATVIANAGDGISQGAELEVSWRVSNALSLSGNIAFTDTEFDDFQAADPVSGAAAGTIDLSGTGFPSVPEVTYGFSANYTRPLTETIDGFSSFSYRYVGDYFSGLGTGGDPRFDYDGYGVADLELGIETDRYRLSMFARNLTDKYAVINTYDAGLGLSGPIEEFSRVIQPRTYGIRLSASY